jgi:hypothetical protein
MSSEQTDAEAPAAAPDSAPNSEEKTLYADLLDAFEAAHKKHEDVLLADVLLLAGSLIGSVIGGAFENYGVLKVGVVRNIESAMQRAVFIREPVAGNA